MRLNLNKLLFATYQPGKGYCRGNHQTRVLGCQFLRSQQLMRMPARREEMELTVDVCQRVGMELSDVWFLSSLSVDIMQVKKKKKMDHSS